MLTERIHDSKVLSAVLLVVLSWLARAQRDLGADQRWVPRLRSLLWPAAHPLLSFLGRPLVAEKTPHEYVLSTGMGRWELEGVIEGMMHRNAYLSKVKWRELPDGTIQFGASWVHKPEGETHQYDYFIFPGHGDYGADVYGHREPRPEVDPEGHTDGGNQIDGDPDGVLRSLLDRQGVDYERDGEWARAWFDARKGSDPTAARG